MSGKDGNATGCLGLSGRLDFIQDGRLGAGSGLDLIQARDDAAAEDVGGFDPYLGNKVAEFAGVGLQLGATVALSAWLGHWLDRKLGTLPWLTILLVFFGAGAAFYSIYRRVMGGPRR